MLIMGLRDGGMEFSVVHGELGRLALLMDRAATHVQESEGSEADSDDLERLAALFTACEVACQLQAGFRSSFQREGHKPTFHTSD